MMYTLWLTGRVATNSPPPPNTAIGIPPDETPRIQEAHILIGHILAEIVEAELFGD